MIPAESDYDDGARALADWLATGYDALYAGDAEPAKEAFRRACSLKPEEGEGWAALAEATESPGACVLFGRATRIAPDNWRWALAYAEAMAATGDSDAEAAFAALVAARPDSAVARRGLATAYAAAGRTAEALAEFREALSLDPQDGATALALARAMIAVGEGLAAIELLQAWLPGGDAAFHAAAAAAWLGLGERGRSREEAERALALDPGNADAMRVRDQLAEAAEETLTPSYVRALFDRYAERFDHDLVDKLGYVAPTLLRSAVDRVRGIAAGRVAIIDLGCGSGLAGETFRPLAARLDGIDLSPRMVEQARRRRIYDSLKVGDVVKVLERSTGRLWDVAVAADVLVYIGALEPLFSAVSRVLTPGGLFAATVERAEPTERGFRLRESRRFVHAVDYVLDCAADAGFTAKLSENCVPRHERGEPVAGGLFVFEKRR